MNYKIKKEGVIIAIGDWILARSEAFKIFMDKFLDHKINTQKSFSRVKLKHNYYDKKIEEHHKRITELENNLSKLTQLPEIRVKRRK
jgi:hypothetical protein